MPAEVTPTAPTRRALFVVGSGRSGTSTLARALELMGMHVPQPVVPADHSNPKGFGESQWVVDFHDRLLRRAGVSMGDARPQAWFDTGKLAVNGKLRERTKSWLDSQYSADVHELVLKDPRLSWFLGLWRQAAERNAIEASYVVMLRPPAEVLASKELYYGAQVSETSRAATWLNLMLHTERATRGLPRSFVRYHDLLEDWTRPIHQLGEDLRIDAVLGATARDLRHVHELIDPGLRRVRTDWADLDVPKAVRELLEETWNQLDRMADGEDTAERHQLLDELRDAYTRRYAEAESLTETTAIAARRRGRAESRKAELAKQRAAGADREAEATLPPESPLPARRRWRPARRRIEGEA